MPDAHDRRPPPPIPLVVLTGFLGSGKTTLLNRLLDDERLGDTAVIINEFGEIGLDHQLVAAADGDLMVLATGCLCCTARGDLVAKLEDLLRGRDNGRIPQFRRVVIETTGLADPVPVLQAVLHHPYLGMRFSVAGVVTLVDAVNGADTLVRHDEAMRQVAVADRIVLTKTDLAEGAAARSALVRQLAHLNPLAPVIDVASADARLVTELGLFDTAGKIADVDRWLGLEHAHGGHGHHHGPAHHHGHHHDGHAHGQGTRQGGHHGGDHREDDHHHHGDHPHHDHTHDVNRHGDRIQAFALVEEKPVQRASFEMFMDLLRSAHGPNVLRVKGLVGLADDPEHPVVVHGVQNIVHPPVALPAWPDDDHRTRMVFILEDLDAGFVERLWGAFTGRPSIDTPDRAALVDNPLSLRRG